VPPQGKVWLTLGLQSPIGCPNRERLLPSDEVLFGLSRSMQMVRQRADKAAATDVAILIEGEGGTGKELLARWIHAKSPWRDGPFVKVSCAAIPGALLESELFGYEKGAFTGAYNCKPGRVEQSRGGTLFLDEVANIDLGMQAKLLQFLQDKCFSRIGGDEESKVETRVICTTNRRLEQEIDEGRFRMDLFYRINGLKIVLPPLRERREDVPILAEYLREQFVHQFAVERGPLSAQIISYLQSLSWPGNIRELSNTVVRYVLLGTDDGTTHREISHARAIAVPDAHSPRGAASLKQIAKDAIIEMQRSVILDVLRANHWNRRKGRSFTRFVRPVSHPGRPEAQGSGKVQANSPVGRSNYQGIWVLVCGVPAKK